MPCATLERHPASPCTALRGIAVSLERSRDGGLRLVYALEGAIERLRIPPPRPPRIAERLWQHTCCEVFIARAGAPGYREFNLSPSGEWAAYAFARYRERSPHADTALSPAIAVRRTAQRFELEASIAVDEKTRLSIGLAAVIEEDNGALSYWALRHAPGKPDFHHPDAFALGLDEVRH